MVINFHKRREKFLNLEAVFWFIIYIIGTPGPGLYRTPSEFGQYLSKHTIVTSSSLLKSKELKKVLLQKQKY